MITPLLPAPRSTASEAEFQIYIEALAKMSQELYELSEKLNAK